jgi:dipeptidyl aminopeptidase/acylaminoacyl peptidase
MLALARVLLVAAALTAPIAAPVLAEPPPLIPREVIFDNPERAFPQISPDGTRLAWLAPDEKNVLQVWVQTVGKDDAKKVTVDKKRGIRRYLWAWNGDLLYLQDTDGDENYQLHVVSLGAQETRNLTAISGVRTEPMPLAPEKPGEALVIMNRRSRALFDVWRLDLASGGLAMAFENPGRGGDFVADADLRVRGMVVLKPEGGGEFQVRDGEPAPWRTVATWTTADSFDAIGFSKDGRRVFVVANLGADTKGLYALDAATGQLAKVASDPGVDVGELLVHPVTREVQAVGFNRDRLRWQVLDQSVKGDFEALQETAPGDLTVINRDRADRTWLVAFSGDTAPARYYAWDRAARKATFLFSARPKLEKYVLAPMKPVEVKARDGLTLPAYLTLPVGVAPKKRPMVLFVHGGPWARDEWGYHPYAQWFANRGYVVLQVNYRGSEGFGKKFRNAALKEFAGKMHTDLVDAVDWAVKREYADPKKVAIMGGSYGGYATLVGVTFTPDLFACGVDIVGPSSLVTLVESFPAYWGPYLSNTWYPFVGDPKDPKARADMEARSPLLKADRIKVPLLIGQGANDPRVTQKESEQVVAAIEKNGGGVSYVLYSDEGHGFARPENRMDFNARAEAFLGECLAGRVEPMAGERMPGSTAQVKVVRGKK